MTTFGRKTAWQRIRRATRQPLSVPSLRSKPDCTPWVLGGLWPADLEHLTPRTEPLAEYLKRDLLRIAASANERLSAITHSDLSKQAREAEEFRVINVARAFAVLRVESTVRQLRREPLGVAPETFGITGRHNRVIEAPPAREPARHRAPDPADFGWSYSEGSTQTADAVQAPTGLEPEVIIDATPTESEPVLVEAVLDVVDIMPGPGKADEPPAAAAAPTEPASGESGPQRLTRLLGVVTRQEPGLRWGIGEFPDGTTVLVTDLAHGWVPPGVEVPEGVTLLSPRRRDDSLAQLLHGSIASNTYSPGDPFGPGSDVATSVSATARQAEAPADLENQLAESTRGRTGLPRLAHALAEIAAAGAQPRDGELDVLRVHLDTARYQLLAQYPDVDPPLLLNCLLLAATEAVATGDARSAGYHFAWFRALSGPPVPGPGART